MDKVHTVHELKTWRAPFRMIVRGHKRAELRWNDRGFKAWDYMLLQEWDEGKNTYTESAVMCQITHVVGAATDFGALADGFVMLSFNVLETNTS
jgi:hypothetical protein